MVQVAPCDSLVVPRAVLSAGRKEAGFWEKPGSTTSLPHDLPPIKNALCTSTKGIN